MGIVKEGEEVMAEGKKKDETAADLALIDIDRVFNCEAIGRARPVRSGITVSEHLTRPFSHQVREAVGENIATPGRNLVGLRRYLLKGGDPVQHMVSVNCGDLYYIRLARRTDNHAADAHPSSTKHHRLR